MSDRWWFRSRGVRRTLEGTDRDGWESRGQPRNARKRCRHSRHDTARDRQLVGALRFLRSPGLRPRAVVVRATTGGDRRSFMTHLRHAVSALGFASVIMLDDAADLSLDDVDVLAERLAQDNRTCIVVAHDHHDSVALRSIARLCDWRIVDLAPIELDAPGARQRDAPYA